MWAEKRWDTDLPSVEAKPIDAVSDSLLKAANYLEENSWCQHSLMSFNGAVCLYGALIQVETEHSWDVETRSALPHPIAEKAMGRIYDTIKIDGVSFNDAPGRTKAEVVAVLRAAAKGGNE